MEKSHQRKGVMVIDDEPDIIKIINSWLKRKSYDFSTFTDPAKALEQFRLKPENYRVVVSDIRMPNLNGFELTKHINKLNPETKVLLMTAFEIKKSEFEKVLPSIQVEGFIQKPFNQSAFLDMIDKHMKYDGSRHSNLPFFGLLL